ncbi:unnamed protein product [Closterium sp. Naga37s-1]|nr:unnamed protein product [Closterium sp. Naga37s-1]
MAGITLFGVTFSLAAIIGISAGILAVILIILSLLTCCCCYMCRGRSPKRRRLDEIAPAPMYPPAMSAAGPGVYAKGMGSRGALPPGPYHHSLSHQQMMGGTEMLPPRYIPPPSPAALMQSPMRPLLGAPPPAGKPSAGAQEEGVVAKWEKDLRAGMFRKVGLAEVEAATGKFSKRAFLGEGAFAAVYKGRSPSGVPFGVVLLELFTGQRAIMMNSRKPGGGDGANPVHISQWAAPLVAAKSLDDLADPKMGGEFEPAVLLRALEIALLCVRPSSKQRPDMGAVVRGLAELREQIMARDEPPETFVEEHARGLDDPDSDEEAEAAQAEQGRAEGSMRVGEETDAPSQEYSRGPEEPEEERDDEEGGEGLIGAADEEQGLVAGSYRGSDIGAGPRQLSGRRSSSGRSGPEGSGRNLGSASGAGSSGRRTEGEPGSVKYSAGVETFETEDEGAHGVDPSSRQYGAPEAANSRSSYYDSGFVYPVGAFGNAYDSGWMPPHGGDRGEGGDRAGSHVVVNLGAGSRR